MRPASIRGIDYIVPPFKHEWKDLPFLFIRKMVLFQLPQKWLAMSFSAIDCVQQTQVRLGEVEVSRTVEFSATCSLINNDRLHLEFSKETLLPFSCQDIFMHYRIGQKVSWHSKVSAAMHLKRRPSDIQGQQLVSIKTLKALALWAPPFACFLEMCLMGKSAMNTATSASHCKRTVHNSDSEIFLST